LAVSLVLPLFAADVIKQNNDDPLNAGSSWVSGVAPTDADEAVWNSTVAGDNSSALTNAVTWNGIKVTNPGGHVTIAGTALLSLDGGATSDINMSAATRDLTIETPVALLFANGINTVAAGRTLTFAGPLSFSAGGTYEAQGAGTVVMKGPVASSVDTTLEIEKGTAVLTGEGGGMTLSGSGARIYVGRNGGNGTLVISNGVHSTGAMSDEAGANFVGVGAWGHLFIENGSLTMKYLREAINSGGNAEIVVNGGTLNVWGGSETATRSGYALMIGNQHQDNGTAVSASGSFTINGGEALFTNGIIKVGSDHSGSTGAQTLVLKGGELALKRFYMGASVQVPKTVSLNGGVLRLTGNGALFDGPGGTNGTLSVYVGDDGAVIDTGANDVTNAAALLAAGTGGLTKLGAGTLTLTGTNTYTGQTRVQAGLMRFTGAAAALHPDLALSASGGLSLRDGLLSAFSPASFTNLTAGAATVELELSASGSACDVLALPAATWGGRLNVAPFMQGTARRAFRTGDYVIMTYAGSAPDVSRFAVLDPAPACTYTFLLNPSEKTVTLRIANGEGVSEWIAAGGGAWETASNWTVAPASAAGTQVLLGDYALASPAAVTVASPVTLGGMAISSLLGYTLSGPGIAFDNGASAPYLTAEKGNHMVAAPLTLTGALTVAPASGAAVTLAGAVSGSGSLVKDGAGEVVAGQANSYSGGTVVKQGAFVLTGPATLGSGTLTVDGGSGFRFGCSAPLTFTSGVVVATTANFNLASNDVALSGDIDWRGASRALVKSGSYALTLSGSGSETELAKLQVENGTLRFASGANFQLLSTSERDAINLKAINSYARQIVVESGSQVTVAGVDMENGISNTVTVSGGSLRLLGGGASGDAVAMRGQGVGVDRFVVDAGEVTVDDGKWFGVGFRVGDAYLVINGGTTTLSRVSLGARDMDMDLSARGFVNINGGLLDVTGNFGWMGSSTVGRTNIVTLGNGTPGSGVWRTCATSNPRYDKNNMPILIFDGGTLEATGLAAYGSSALSDYLYGAKVVSVGAGGARIDTMGLDVTLKQPLQKGAVTDGGLTKLGAGRLTLAGACAFTGPTTLSEGALAVPASYASGGLSAAAGTELILVNGAAQTLTLSAATLATGAKITFEALADASACDRIDLPSGATVGDLTVSVVQAGTSVPASRPGDYVLFTVAGSAPAVSGWTLLNPPAGRSSSLEIAGDTVVLRIAYAAGPSIWTNNGSGEWDVAGNWTALPADAAGAAVRFDDAIAAPATVTHSAGSTVGSVIFNNLQPYTLDGAGVTLASGGAEPAEIKAESGVHTVTAPLTLAGETVVRAAAGAAVALNGNVSGSTALTVEGPGALALPDLSGLAVPSLNLVGAGVLAVSNTATLTTPVSLGAGGGVLAPAAGTTLDVSSLVTGTGSLTKQGSSFAVLTNANANYSGVTKIKAGTLRLDTLPGGGVEFGQGTLHYVGAGATTASGYTLDTGDATRAGVLRADGDITFQGSVSAASGALVKTGPGTVAFTAPGLNVFNAGNGAGASHSALDIGAFGDSPATGFSGFSIADGKVVVGAEGQTNLFNGLLVVGLNSTTNADAETAGLLDVAGGVTAVSDTLIVGRSNGTTNTAPVARVSKLRLLGGDLTVGTLVLGRVFTPAGHNSAPEAELLGGLLTATNTVFVGEQAGSVATLKLNGGTLVAPNIARVNGQGHVQFNGGVFRPSADGQTMQSLTSAKVGAGGARFDLSLANAYTLSQALTTDGADGGLTKTGAGTLVVSGRQRYDGPTLVSEGTLRIPFAGSLSNVTFLTVSPGAALALDTANTQTVSLAGMTLGADAASPVGVTLAFLADGTANSRLAAAGPVALGTVAFTFVRAGLGDAFGLNGTYTLITYTGADPSFAGLSVANPQYGKRYAFAADSGVVTVTISADYTVETGGATWKAETGGTWSDAGNWVTAPGAGGAGQRVRFDSSITAPATVTLDAAATVGTAYFSSANAYTLAGSEELALNNGASTQALVSVELGSHTLAAPVAVSDEGVVVQTPLGTALTLAGAVSGSGPLVKIAGGPLTVSAASTRTGATEIQGGELYVKDGGSVGSGELVLDGAAGLRAVGTAPSTLSNPVTFKSAGSGAPIIRAEEQALTLSGALDWQTGVAVAYKWGTNELVLAGTGGSVSGTPKLYVRQGGLTFASGADYTLTGNSRESIKLGLNANIKTSMTVEEGVRLSLGGILVSADTAGAVGNDALITQNGGTLTLSNTSGDGGDAFYLRDWGTAPATYAMNGGTFTMPQASWANVGNYGPGRITVNGGSMTLGRFAAGVQMTVTNAASGGSTEVTVNGGRLAAAGSWSWTSDSGARPTDVVLNGGTLALPATRAYGTNANRWASLTLSGGTLETTGAALDTSALDDYLSGVRRVALGAAGSVIDTKALNVTVRQNVLGLTSTGGVAKVGSGTLTLEGTNTLWGLVDVREGTLRARLTHLDLPATPLFRYGMDSVANPDLSGNGLALTVANPSNLAVTNRTPAATALAFNGSGFFSAPHNPHFTNVTEFTVAAWILLTNNAVGSSCSILSTRPGGDKAFELKLNEGNLLRVLQHSSGDWWQEFRTVNAIPLGQWTHVAASLNPQGVAMYLNGVRQSPIKQVYTGGGTMRDYPGSGYYFPGDFRFVPAGRTGGFMIGRPTVNAGPGFCGGMDDLMLFERALTDAEVAALASETPVRPASVRVAWQGVFDMLGETTQVAEASGSGQIVNGTLAVKDRLAVGDTDAEQTGAMLTVANLTFGTNVTYACSCDGAVSDLTLVSGLLQVNGAGVVDFGRTASNPISGNLSITVMTYGAVSGGANFANWKVTGLGRRGYITSVKAENNAVIVTLKSTYGTLMQLK
jgi:autotransporter-associated beta strand protein